MAEHHVIMLSTLDLAHCRFLINTDMLLLLEIFRDLVISVSVPKSSSYLLGIWRQEFWLNEARVNIFRTHRLVKPIWNDRYLFEASIVPILLITDLTSVLFQFLTSLGILAWLLLDVDFASLVLGTRHCLQTAVVAHSRRTVAINGQVVSSFAVLHVLEFGRSSLRYNFNVRQNCLSRLFVHFTCINPIS